MKPLFQRIIDILEEQNDIAYSPSIHNGWKKRRDKNGAPTLVFFELSNEYTPRFSKEVAPKQRLAVERQEVFCYEESLLCLMFKKDMWGEPTQRIG